MDGAFLLQSYYTGIFSSNSRMSRNVKTDNDICKQLMFRSAGASAQADQHICCSCPKVKLKFFIDLRDEQAD